MHADEFLAISDEWPLITVAISDEFLVQHEFGPSTSSSTSDFPWP